MGIQANPNSYYPLDKEIHNRQARIEIVVGLDMVPGAWHQTEDFIQWLHQHPYVRCTEIKQEF